MARRWRAFSFVSTHSQAFKKEKRKLNNELRDFRLRLPSVFKNSTAQNWHKASQKNQAKTLCSFAEAMSIGMLIPPSWVPAKQWIKAAQQCRQPLGAKAGLHECPGALGRPPRFHAHPSIRRFPPGSAPQAPSLSLLRW
jgi:hypothetical protein